MSKATQKAAAEQQDALLPVSSEAAATSAFPTSAFPTSAFATSAFPTSGMPEPEVVKEALTAERRPQFCAYDETELRYLGRVCDDPDTVTETNAYAAAVANGHTVTVREL